MLGGAFTEELKKNKVLSNKSNKFARLYFNNFSGKKTLTLYGSVYLNYGYLVVDCENAEILKVYYKDILISCINGTKQVIIPLAIENNSEMIIEGSATKAKVLLFGAKFYNEKCDYIIPMKNYKIENAGNFSVKQYTSKEDFLSNNLTKIFEFNKLYSAQVVKLSGELVYSNLINDNGLCLCVEKDNYTKRLLSNETIKDATIMASNVDDIYVIYIKQGKLFYKKISASLELSEELQIDKKVNLTPIAFCPIEIYDFNINMFGVVWNNGTISIFQFKDNVFSNIFSFKGEKVKLQVFADEMNIVKITDYFVSVNKYKLSSGGVSLKDSDSYEYKLNANNYYLINDSKVYFNDENYTEL